LTAIDPTQLFYLSPEERVNLAEVGKTKAAVEAAGTYAKHVFNRLLIDLSWNSSRLEGNTYSLLDTRRLIEFGEEAQGGNRLEAQMILNHKDAKRVSMSRSPVSRFASRFFLHRAFAFGFAAPPHVALHRVSIRTLDELSWCKLGAGWGSRGESMLPFLVRPLGPKRARSHRNTVSSQGVNMIIS
jgi:hypothetical protein